MGQLGRHIPQWMHFCRIDRSKVEREELELMLFIQS
ncbi:Hypothetical protein Minf_1597 [Methylacidiphilum infernorum V4]|uniref:Uncharacterized protein n=1 Tax=Methylacidiphilum infernorum (isolate V4) TaxID=481448 RepID=B3DWE8_METI4|nr:Hypothetical protein Minf_1597 [Methylacidiphilum infernorum V4]